MGRSTLDGDDYYFGDESPRRFLVQLYIKAKLSHALGSVPNTAKTAMQLCEQKRIAEL